MDYVMKIKEFTRKGSRKPQSRQKSRFAARCAFAAAILLCSCRHKPDAAQTDAKRVFYLNSYHEKYGTSAPILSGIRESMAGQPVALTVFYLDAKRNPEENAMAAKVKEALAAIRKAQPDVIIVSDDDAVKRVVVPHLKGGKTPVIFCGVNWSAASYGLPAGNVTGMVEVVPVAETIQTLKRYYPRARTLWVLSENTLSEQKNRQVLDTTFRRLGLKTQYALVDDFAAWKEKFVAANREADLIYLPTNGGIRHWDEAQARAFVARHIRKPVLACDDFMMPYAVFGLTKVAGEQGAWAGRVALQVLHGKPVPEIPLGRNRQTKAWFNPLLAGKIHFTPDSSLLHSATLISANPNASAL
jgi:ABC-type uncharacterized transport system substrate-binding protein